MPTKVSHPIFARFYAWISPRMEQAGYAEHRDELIVNALLEDADADRRAVEHPLDAHFVVLEVLCLEPTRRQRGERALRRQDLRAGGREEFLGAWCDRPAVQDRRGAAASTSYART